MKKKTSKKNVIKGRWYNINKKIKKRLVAKYHKIKDWKPAIFIYKSLAAKTSPR